MNETVTHQLAQEILETSFSYCFLLHQACECVRVFGMIKHVDTSVPATVVGGSVRFVYCDQGLWLLVLQIEKLKSWPCLAFPVHSSAGQFPLLCFCHVIFSGGWSGTEYFYGCWQAKA